MERNMSEKLEWSEHEEALIKKFDQEISDGLLQKTSFNNPQEAIEWLMKS